MGTCVVVSGGARGPDRVAERTARRLGYPEARIHLPNWKLHGRAAGMIRNKTIVDDSDGLILFWDGKSSGTKGTIELTRRAEKPLILILESDRSLEMEMERWETGWIRRILESE